MTTSPVAPAQQTSLWLLALCVLSLLPIHSDASQNQVEDCLRSEVLKPANNHRTVGELREICSDNSTPQIQDISEPAAALTTVTGNINAITESLNPPLFEPYKSNYIVFGSLENHDGGDPFSGKTLDIKFELGMKLSVFSQLEGMAALTPLKFGYSQRSWWDIAESSAPFKEHNYNPELFWDFTEALRKPASTPRLHLVDIAGFEHQSNGLDGTRSRSWDRIYARRDFHLSETLSWTVKLWNVVKEGEFNEDITDYLGNAEVTTHIDINNWANLNIKLLKGHATEKVSYQADLILPMSRWINSRFVLSYYDGYGEALISYNEKTRSVRAGFYFPLGF